MYDDGLNGAFNEAVSSEDKLLFKGSDLSIVTFVIFSSE